MLSVISDMTRRWQRRIYPPPPRTRQAGKPEAKKAPEALKIKEKRLTKSTKYSRISIETNRKGQQPRRPKLKAATHHQNRRQGHNTTAAPKKKGVHTNDNQRTEKGY